MYVPTALRNLMMMMMMMMIFSLIIKILGILAGNPGNLRNSRNLGNPRHPRNPRMFFLHLWASGASRLNPACFFLVRFAFDDAPNGLTATRFAQFVFFQIPSRDLTDIFSPAVLNLLMMMMMMMMLMMLMLMLMMMMNL